MWLSRMADRYTFAALGAARRENASAPGFLHPRAEAVRTHALAPVWLIGSFSRHTGIV